MKIMKRQKDMIPEDEHPGQKVSNTLLEKSRETVPDGMKRGSQSGNNTQLWMCLVVNVKSSAIKNNIA